MVDRGVDVRLSHPPEHGIGLHYQVPGAQVLRRAGPRAHRFGFQQFGLNRCDDFSRDLILQFKYIGELAVVAVGPDVIAGRGIDQLRGDPHAVAALADTAFQHVAHAKLARGALHVDGLALVRERGVARDYEEPAQLRQPGDDVLGNAVREIFLLGIAADIVERQDRDRRTVGRVRLRGLRQMD